MASKRELVVLASRAKKYDPEAFGKLYELYFAKLKRYIYYQIGDVGMAEELASEVFSKALGSIDRFDDRGGTVGAWLYGIAKNLINKYREATAKAHLVDLEDASSTSTGGSPEAEVMRNETHEEILHAIGELTEEQKDVVILRFIEGYSVKTVAGLMNKNASSVRALQYRAIVAIRAIMSSREESVRAGGQ